jgi:hypothetical protein
LDGGLHQCEGKRGGVFGFFQNADFDMLTVKLRAVLHVIVQMPNVWHNALQFRVVGFVKSRHVFRVSATFHFQLG